MFLLSKKSILKKVFLSSLSVCLVLMAVLGIIYIVQKRVTAATPDGGSVVITKGESIGYGHGWATSRFSVTTGGQSITGYCANPSKKSLEGTFPAIRMANSNNNNLIKLMIYVSTVNNSITTPVMNDLFSSISNTDKRYAYSHAVIGALYANDYHRLETSDVNMVNGIITKLQNLVNNNSDAWTIAKNYQLYTIDRSGTAYADDGEYQDIMWIEDDYVYGNIKVEKHDSETGSTPQGGGSLQGINFEVYNDSGARIYNPKTNQFYNNGALVASGSTNASGQVTFSNLVAGKYKVKETATNSTYLLTDGDPKSVTIPNSGGTITVVFENDVKTGAIIVNKNDKELGSCNQLGKANFSNIKFQVINNSANPIYYNDSLIAVGSVVSEKSLRTSDCTVEFPDLPYGSYKVKEVGSGVGYLANSEVIDVTIPSGDTRFPHVTFNNQVIRGDVKFKKVNQDGQPMANIPFRITSKTTGESHIVVSDENGVVNTSASVNLHSNHTNGYDSATNFDNVTYQGYGTWFGKSASSSDVATVDDSLGALPYDTYDIVEISCEQNSDCQNIDSEKQTFEITTNSTVVDLGDWENNCYQYTLGTTATDNSDGDKLIIATSGAKIKDVIDYCFKAGTTFTIKGTLMDKTANRLLTNGSGQAIEQTITVTPTDDCGQAVMVFEIDASALAGHEIVVFEKAYQNNKLVHTHEDINDAGQTVNIVSLGTTATDNADGDKYVVANSNAKIKDTINYCLKAGIEFTIKGILMDKATGEALRINGATVEKSIKVTPTINCDQVEMIFDVNASSLAGHEIVVFETAYQGNKLVAAHENINDVAQTIDIISLATTAVDRLDNDKFIVADSGSQIKDTINYCLKTGVAFTIKGTLMDKTTGEALTNGSGQAIENTITINPTKACDKAEMYFEFDTSTLAGHEIVVFEKVYQNNTLIIAHEDINDTAQTVSVINFSTFAENGEEIEEEEEVDDGTGEEDEEESGEEDSGSEEDDDEEEEENEEENLELRKKLVEIGEKTKIKDTITYCLRKNTDFTIKGTLIDKKTGEALTVDGEIIEESIDITTENACGQAEMMFEVDTSSLAGHEIVVFEKLYYNNEFVMSHEDIDDEGQTVLLIDLTTFATNVEDGTKDVMASGMVRIRDVVKYYLKAGTEYTVRGILMNKNTKKPLLVDGKTIEQTITFVPEDNYGETEMFYEFDASSLGGVDVVIFEDVYIGKTLLIRHEDFENKDETFYILTPAPDTGYITTPLDNVTERNNIIMVVVVANAVIVSGYLLIRIKAKNKFLYRH